MNWHLHASHWLHPQMEHEGRWYHLLHNETFWIVFFAALVLVAAAVMVIMVGQAPPIKSTPYVPGFPY